MSASAPDTAAATGTCWFGDPQLAGDPPPELLGWLTEAGLLTRRLQRACGSGFRLEVIREIATAAAGADAHREVVLYCNDRPCIYAATQIPASTLAAHPWLARLGSMPLGEALHGRPGVERSAFEYAQLPSAGLPDDLLSGEDAAWARRSTFRLGAFELGVTEVFLHALSDVQRAQAAG